MLWLSLLQLVLISVASSITMRRGLDATVGSDFATLVGVTAASAEGSGGLLNGEWCHTRSWNRLVIGTVNLNRMLSSDRGWQTCNVGRSNEREVYPITDVFWSVTL